MTVLDTLIRGCVTVVEYWLYLIEAWWTRPSCCGDCSARGRGTGWGGGTRGNGWVRAWSIHGGAPWYGSGCSLSTANVHPPSLSLVSHFGTLLDPFVHCFGLVLACFGLVLACFTPFSRFRDVKIDKFSLFHDSGMSKSIIFILFPVFALWKRQGLPVLVEGLGEVVTKTVDLRENSEKQWIYYFSDISDENSV